MICFSKLRLVIIILVTISSFPLFAFSSQSLLVQAKSSIPMVSAGGWHTVGLRSDGTVIAVGNNQYGQCDVSSWKDIVQVSTGDGHTVGLKSDGTVIAVGDNYAGQCEVSSWEDIIQIAAGNNYTVGLKSNGRVVFVGPNGEGNINLTSWRHITQISAGMNQIVGLKADGRVVATGIDNGQLDVDSWTDIIQVAAGGNFTVGLKSDGSVVATGINEYGQCNVNSWRGITQVSAGDWQTLGLKANGTVVAVGNNSEGQCEVSSWEDIAQVEAGFYHSVGLKKDGTVIAASPLGAGQGNVASWRLKPILTMTTLTSDKNPSIFGQSINLIAEVNPIPNGGKIQFQDNGVDQGSPINVDIQGKSKFRVPDLSVGTHVFTAIYSGNSDYDTSTSAFYEQVVNRAGSSVGIRSSVNPSISGQGVEFIATITSSVQGVVVPTGTIQFYVDGLLHENPVFLVGGIAISPTITVLSISTHTITAVYSGDNNFYPSTGTFIQIVDKIPTKTSLYSSANPSTYEKPVNFTAGIIPIPTNGKIQFQDDGSNLGSPLKLDSSGQAYYTLPDLSTGIHLITADFIGDETFASSNCYVIQIINGPRWDVNEDHHCNILDVIQVAIHFKQTGTPGWIREDVNEDGVVNLEDIKEINKNRGRTW